eukprot:3934028-Rhodomonas_salina.2
MTLVAMALTRCCTATSGYGVDALRGGGQECGGECAVEWVGFPLCCGAGRCSVRCGARGAESGGR